MITKSTSLGNELSLRNSRRTILLIVGALTLCGLIIRIWNLGGPSFWQDEVLTLKIISGGWTGLIWRGASISSSPPLYYAIERLFFLLSPSEFGMRLSSVIFGSLTIPVFFFFTTLLTNQRIALISSVLLVFSPFHIWYSQDARPYALFMLLCLAATHSFIKFLSTGSRYWQIVYTVLIIMGLYVHIMISLLLVCHFGLWLVWPRTNRPAFWKVMSCYLITGLCFLPVLPVLLKGMGVAYGIDRPFSLLVVPYTFYALLSGFSLGPSTYILHDFSYGAAVAPFIGSFILFTLVFIPCIILGVVSLAYEKKIFLTLVFWLVIPICILAALSTVTHHSYNVRYISSVVFPILIICATGIERLASVSLKVLFLVGILFCQSLAVWNYFTDSSYAKADFRSAALYLEKMTRPGDAVYVTGHLKPFLYYFRKSNVDVIEQGAFRMSYSQVEGKMDAISFSEMDKRLWLVETRWEQYDPGGYAKTFCKSKLKPCIEKSVKAIPQPGRIKMSCYRVSP